VITPVPRGAEWGAAAARRRSSAQQLVALSSGSGHNPLALQPVAIADQPVVFETLTVPYKTEAEATHD
jgi:hypothetical protein